MQDALQNTYYSNSLQNYLLVAGIILGSILILFILKKVFIRRLQKFALHTKTTVDEYVINSLDRFGLPVLQLIIGCWALSLLNFPARVSSAIDTAASIALTYFVIRLLSSLIMRFLESRIRHSEHGEVKIKQLGGLMLVINIVIWMIGIVFLLDNMGKDVTTIITGLGIGGIAIALAAQNILGDLFNYFVIYFDRPFEVGDFIVVDDKMGTVEYLGIKTTRIRSLGGEQIIIGNSNLTSSRIQNFKRLAERRVTFMLNVDYRTPIAKVRMIPDLIRLIILQQEKVRFDRSHFATYGDWSLRFETVYFVLDPDFNKYMDIQQEINLKISEAFKDHEIYMVTGFHMTLSPPAVTNADDNKLPKKDKETVSESKK
jgi:small-conductance mechanosensitive channel